MNYYGQVNPDQDFRYTLNDMYTFSTLWGYHKTPWFWWKFDLYGDYRREGPWWTKPKRFRHYKIGPVRIVKEVSDDR